MIGRLLAFAAAVGGGVFFILRSIQVREDREPIRIRNKKLRFDLRSKKWKKGDDSGRLWHIDHPDGHSVAKFAVAAIAPEDRDPFCAATVRFKVVVGGQILEYTLGRDLAMSGKWHPVVSSPPNIEIGDQGKRLRIKNEPDVWISEVYGDDQLRYTFDENTDEIHLVAKPQR